MPFQTKTVGEDQIYAIAPLVYAQGYELQVYLVTQ